MTNDPNYMHLVWNQIRDRGGMQVSPYDLRNGDKVTVTGTGYIGGVLTKFPAVSGVVRAAGWDRDHRFTFRVYVEAWVELPSVYWHDPTVTFDTVELVERVIRYNA